MHNVYTLYTIYIHYHIRQKFIEQDTKEHLSLNNLLKKGIHPSTLKRCQQDGQLDRSKCGFSWFKWLLAHTMPHLTVIQRSPWMVNKPTRNTSSLYGLGEVKSNHSEKWCIMKPSTRKHNLPIPFMASRLLFSLQTVCLMLCNVLIKLAMPEVSIAFPMFVFILHNCNLEVCGFVQPGQLDFSFGWRMAGYGLFVK